VAPVAGAGVAAAFTATVATAAGAGAVVGAAGLGGAAVAAGGRGAVVAAGAGAWGVAGAHAVNSETPVTSALPTTNCRRVSLSCIRSDIGLPPLRTRGTWPLARPAYTALACVGRAMDGWGAYTTGAAWWPRRFR